MKKRSRIYVSGHTGLVGKALLEELVTQGYTNIVTKSHQELDLINQQATEQFFKQEQPEYVFHLAAKVGGIKGNSTYPADFFYENAAINLNVIHSAHMYGVKKLINLGSVCIYPKFAQVPIKEEYLLTGKLEYTNEAYAVAKIASLMMCKKYKEQYGDNFVSVMPANLYGPYDNFNMQNAHVIPMLMKRFVEAKEAGKEEVIVWGSGKQTRDFLFSKDLANGLVFIMKKYNSLEHINISQGKEVTIKYLAELIKKVTGFQGKIVYDKSQPDGTPKRYLNVSKLNSLGWRAKTSLEAGIDEMYQWFIDERPLN